MNLFGMLEISGSAMTAERQRAQIVVSNMANAQTTQTSAGGPYRRQLVVFRAQRHPEFPATMSLAANGGHAGAGEGVRVSQVIADSKPPILRYEPGNPDADAKGYVAYRVLLAIEQMLSYRTEVCLITSGTLEAALVGMEQKGKCSDKSFDDRRGAEEIIRITSSYALKLKAEDVRIVAFGEFMWVKLAGTGDTANLLFSRRSAGMEDSPVQSVLARVAG